MATTRIIAITISILLIICMGIIGYVIYDDKINNNCGLDEKRAGLLVMNAVKQRNLPLQHLRGPIDQRGSCRYGYNYLGNGEHLYFLVESTWTKGVKITYFDYIRQNQQ